MVTRRLHRLGRSIIFAGGSLAGLLSWNAGPSFAQPPSAVESTQAPESSSIRQYRKDRDFRLPIQIDEKSRGLIREIQLFVKDRPGAAWTICGVVGPDRQFFEYHAKHDGEFAFAMVTVDTKGRAVPDDLRNEPPGMIVVIDSEVPRLELVNLGKSPQGQLIQFDARDPHLNIGRVALFFQGGDKVFRPMEEVQGRANVYRVPAEAVYTGLFRATAADLSGNVATTEAHLQELATEGTPPSARQPVAVLPKDEPREIALAQPLTPSSPQALPQPLPREVTATPQELPNGNTIIEGVQLVLPQTPAVVTPKKEAKGTPPPVTKVQQVEYRRPDGTDGPHFSDGTSAPKSQVVVQPTGPALPQAVTVRKELPKRQLVNQGRILLDYQVENVGLSGVGKVEVWLTRDEGKNWIKHCEDAQRKNAVEVMLPEDGLFGVTLVVTNGRGSGYTPPVAGDRPDMLIELDATSPTAKLTGTKAEFSNGATAVLISWNCSDRNLADSPVDLYHGPSVDGPWLPIAKGLKAEGQHRWACPSDIGAKAFVRVAVRDLAGNTAAAGTTEPVMLDDPARPRGVIRGIRTEPTQD